MSALSDLILKKEIDTVEYAIIHLSSYEVYNLAASDAAEKYLRLRTHIAELEEDREKIIDKHISELADLHVKITEIEYDYLEYKALTQWQPIETAPTKPEGDYLGFQCGEVFKMYWNYFRDGWVDCCSEVFSEPSHWMPLPKPPEAL